MQSFGTYVFSSRLPRRSLGLAVVGVTALAVSAVGAGVASASSPSHTLRLTTTQIEDVIQSSSDIAADRDAQNGKTTGYDVTTCLINRQTHMANCDIAAARAGGLLFMHSTVNVLTGQGHGQVLGGTRAFHSASGTVDVSPGASPNQSKITIVYRT